MEKQFLVALHVESRRQTFRELQKILIEGGAHGALLVNNGSKVRAKELLEFTFETQDKFPDHIIGINALDLSTKDVLELVTLGQIERRQIRKLSSQLRDLIVWSDDGGIRELNDKAYLDPELEYYLRGNSSVQQFCIKYYGGVAFKYQPQPKNLKSVSELADRRFSVVVTSGAGTGQAADIEKIKAIKSFIGTSSLALASGTTKENLYQYWPYVDVYIVGTSLLEDVSNQYLYSQQKVKDFRETFELLKL